MEIFLIRHGLSEGNIGLDMSPDPVLTSLGREQAQLTGEWLLREVPFHALYCSPLLRAMETASIIGEALGLVAEVWPHLAEVAGDDFYSGFRGVPRSLLLRQFPGISCPPEMTEDGWSVPGNEDAEAISLRALRVEEDLRDRHEEDNHRVIVVSHGTFGSMLIGSLIRVAPQAPVGFSQHNCCISRIVFTDSRTRLYTLNQIEHLPERART